MRALIILATLLTACASVNQQCHDVMRDKPIYMIVILGGSSYRVMIGTEPELTTVCE